MGDGGLKKQNKTTTHIQMLTSANADVGRSKRSILWTRCNSFDRTEMLIKVFRFNFGEKHPHNKSTALYSRPFPPRAALVFDPTQTAAQPSGSAARGHTKARRWGKRSPARSKGDKRDQAGLPAPGSEAAWSPRRGGVRDLLKLSTMNVTAE